MRKNYLFLLIFFVCFIPLKAQCQNLDHSFFNAKIDSIKEAGYGFKYQMVQWYFKNHLLTDKTFSRKYNLNKNDKIIGFLESPVFIVDSNCFYEIDCKIGSPLLINCLKYSESSYEFFFTTDSINWYQLSFSHGSFGFDDNSFPFTANFVGINFISYYDLISTMGDGMFFLENFHANYNNGEFYLYTGGGSKEKISEFFSNKKKPYFIDIRFWKCFE